MSEWNMDPEVVCIAGGSIEVHPAEFTRVHRGPDGTVRVFLHSENGFFAFGLTPAQARALAASVDRHCPDADPADTVAAGTA